MVVGKDRVYLVKELQQKAHTRKTVYILYYHV